MTTHVFKIENGKFGLSLTDPGKDACAAKIADYATAGAFTCQITSGALNASQNISQDTVPATWCEPEQQTPKVGATSYSLDLDFLQDPDVVGGLSQFLFEHDTEEAYFFMGMDGDDPPKAIGKVRLVAGTLGGEGRTILTASVSLPVDGKPGVCFGTSAGSDLVGDAPTGATAGTPGTWNPAGSDAPKTLTAANALGLTLGAAWATGEYVTLSDATSSHVHWDGTKFATGDAP